MVHGVAILLINLPVHVAARDALTDSADVGIPTVRNEAENSIAVSPLDSRVLFVSNIANVTAGVTSWFSLDAGKSWLTSDSLVLAPSFADPAVAIGRTGGTYGRFFVNHLDSNVDYELGIHYKSATGGTSWTHVEISDGKASGPGTDKNHLAVNNNTSGSFQNYIVTAWHDLLASSSGVYAAFCNFANNDSVRTYVSVSFDGADTWTDFQVSDGAGWDGDDGFAGHYIGIAAKDGIAFPIWSDDRVTNTVFKPYVSPIYLWGVTQSSIAHSAVSAPELELTVTVEWDTSMPATGTDYLVLTSPTNVVYTATATPSSPGTSHEVEKLCPCEAGDWSYIVKSTRPGFTPRGSNPKTLRITACVD